MKLVAPFDGLIRSVDARLGVTVRESQDLVQFDPTEANARLRIAAAELKEKQAGAQQASSAGGQAQIEAAEARVELARALVDRCSVRAPFAGRVVDVPVCPGQYVLKGTTLVELADTSSLRAIMPVDRRSVAVGSTLTVPVEEQEVPGKVQAILPLPESFAVLRELATPFAAASVVFPNTKGQLDAGLPGAAGRRPLDGHRQHPQAGRSCRRPPGRRQLHGPGDPQRVCDEHPRACPGRPSGPIASRSPASSGATMP